MNVKETLENTLDVKNVTVGVSVVILAGMMSLTTIAGCSSHQKIKNLRQAVKTCRKDNGKIIKRLRSESKKCSKKLKKCKKIRNKMIEKIGKYEKRLCK